MQNHYAFMKIALEEAQIAYRDGEVPVGAVLVSFSAGTQFTHYEE
jgi:tRNA(Arg) A34 adenosine deaminase TadA